MGSDLKSSCSATTGQVYEQPCRTRSDLEHECCHAPRATIDLMGPFTLPNYDKAQDLFAEACLNVHWYWNATFGQHEAGVYAPIESFVTKIAILDGAHYSEQYGQAYSVFKEGRREGRTVNGLMFVRNAEIHSVTRQELSEAGLIGIPGPVQALRERPAWIPFAELPRDYVERSDGTPRASRRRIAAYKCEVGDKTVLDTMMTALGFFMSLDSELVTPEALKHFPLQGGFPRSYERLAPFWPPYREWAIEHSRALPAASEREVVRPIVNNGRTVGLAGYSPLIGWTRNGWWETVNDIAHDIKRKYRYYIVTDVGQVELTLAEGRVTAVTGDENVLDRLPTDQRDLERLKAQRDTLLDMYLQNRREP